MVNKLRMPGMENMEKLTIDQAYLAVYIFLDELRKRINSDDIAGFITDMAVLQDGTPADDAAWEDWLYAVAKARDDKNWEIAEFRIVVPSSRKK
jgi:hypothetical protein